jgi:Putative peptidoglycan binding domain
MARREQPRSPDPDDWFAEPEPVASRRDRAGARAGRPSGRPAAANDEDDWTAEGTRAPLRARSRFVDSLPDRWVQIAAGAVLVVTLVVGGLALAGVFSGSKPNNTAATTVASSPTTAPTTTTTAPVVAAPTTTLKPGDTGAQVRALQRALVHLGYSVKVDGTYGPATTSAVMQFQRASKLTADGVFGAATRAALVKALAAG